MIESWLIDWLFKWLRVWACVSDYWLIDWLQKKTGSLDIGRTTLWSYHHKCRSDWLQLLYISTLPLTKPVYSCLLPSPPLPCCGEGAAVPRLPLTLLMEKTSHKIHHVIYFNPETKSHHYILSQIKTALIAMTHLWPCKLVRSLKYVNVGSC